MASPCDTSKEAVLSYHAKGILLIGSGNPQDSGHDSNNNCVHLLRKCLLYTALINIWQDLLHCWKNLGGECS